MEDIRDENQQEDIESQREWGRFRPVLVAGDSREAAAAVQTAAAAVGDWWASSSIWDKLDMAMTIVGFIPGLDVISDAGPEI